MREKYTLGRVQQRRSRAEVEQLVDAFESSGLRRREFCQKHDVVVGTLDFWRKRRRQKRGVVAGHPVGAPKVHVGAEVASSGRLVAVELAGTATSSRLAVVLPRGGRVEVSEGFDAATLERLLTVLEQA
jgi:transposase-like protein